MTADFHIKEGDTLPALSVALKDAAGRAANLAGAAVRFHMRRPDATMLHVDAPAAIVSAPDGTVRYDWSAADTAAPGDYCAEFEVTFADGKRESFPNDRNLLVRIAEQVG